MRGKAAADEQHQIDRERMRSVLRERMGLDTETVGPFFLDSILTASTRASGYRSAREFMDATVHQHKPWQTLVQHAAVAESWFFRDRNPFELFTEEARRRWTHHQPEPVRVLSYPCASGEEPFSMRIALTEAGMAAETCTIDGADISEAALRRAHAGTYSERSFRGCDEALRENHFTRLPNGRWQIQPRHAASVRLEEANLLEGLGLEREYRYGIVFCRNLLIYLCDEARQRLLAELEKRMQPDALLVVGHAEAGIVREAGYKGEGNPAAFAFRRSEQPSYGTASATKTPTRKTRPAQPELSIPQAVRELKPAHAEPAMDSLDEIRRSADGGAVERAFSACQRYVAHHPSEAEAHYLLGVLFSAQGFSEEAEKAYRKTLYLNPAHAEAKLHLALTRGPKRAVQEEASRTRKTQAAQERMRP